MTTQAKSTTAAKSTAPKPAPPKDDTADGGVQDDAKVHDGQLLDEDQDRDAAGPAETAEQKRARLQRELDELDPPPAPKDEPTREETREEKRARLNAELAKVDEEARLHGGYKEVPTHIGVLLCGDQVNVTNANATTHHCDNHQADVPFVAFHAIPEDLRQKLAGV